MSPHAFSSYVRLLGRGRTLSRALTFDEAESAMAMILAGEALPEQIGAFLMLLRIKEETGDEIAGFTRAARARIPDSRDPPVDLDWPCYAGKKRQLPWHLLAALILAQRGWRIALHGQDGHTEGRLYAGETLAALGLPLAGSLGQARAHLAERNLAYLELASIDAELARLMMLKPVLGLRSPVNTVVRGLNPFRAWASLQAVFHPGYVAVHRDAALRLGDDRVWIFRGEGGENERRPNKPCEITAVEQGAARTFSLAPLMDARQGADETLDVARLAAVWRGARDVYGEGAIVGTIALALGAMRVESDPAAADERARALWEERDREHFLADRPAGTRPSPPAMGRVYLVGAGPGNRDLLTLRALRLIRQCEVALYDNLVDASILACLPAGAERIYVGKRPDHHAVPQDEIGRMLIAHAQRGKRVLRLKGGDPFMFGRGGEEIETLVEHGVPFEVCPGVTAALGCAAYAGIPLTHRDHAQACVFITARGRAGRLTHDWPSLIRPGQTLAIYMGLVEIEAMMAEAVAQGVDPLTPAAIVDNGARVDQRVVAGTIGDLAAKAREAALRGPTIIIVGSVVKLREKLDWREKLDRADAPMVGDAKTRAS